MSTKKTVLIVLAILVPLCLCVVGTLAAIGVPAILTAQRASRDSLRLRELEVVRNTMSDYYTKTAEEPYICASEISEKQVWVGSADEKCRDIDAVEVVSVKGYNFHPVESCQPSRDRDIFFKPDYREGLLYYCKEGERIEVPLQYK